MYSDILHTENFFLQRHKHKLLNTKNADLRLFDCKKKMVRPAGIEPTLPAPEADVLSAGLRAHLKPLESLSQRL